MSPMNNRLLVPRKTPGLLDLVPGAAAAYSLRSLSRSYAGPVVTVRRSSDDAEDSFTAAEVSDGTLAAFCGAGDGFVKTWFDQSGNENHAGQATAGSQPQIVDTGVVVLEEGKPALRFDGNRNIQRALNISQPITQVAVATLSDGLENDNNDYRLTWASPSEVALYKDDAATPDSFNMFAGNYPVLVGKNADVAQNLWWALFFAASSVFYINSVTQASGNAGANGIGTLAIGAENTGIKGWNGTIQEIIIYPSDVTAQRELIEGNIAWSYSV